jgi:transposase
VQEVIPVPTRRLLNDEQWAAIAPLLPTLSSKGRPWSDNREVLEGILWVLRTGAPWNDMPDDLPSDSTCWRRLQKWEEDGTWERVWRAFLNKLDRRGWLKWEETFADASFMPAKKGATQSASRSAARARSAWWWSTARVFLSEQPYTPPRRRNRA